MQIIKDKKTTFLIPSHSQLFPKDKEEEQQQLDQFFNPNYWSKQNQIIGNSVGRNITYFIQSKLSENQWVLRHYYRGGLIAKLIKDRYLFSSLENTRVFKEIALLEKMQSMDLPVPKAVGGRVKLNGLFYQADLMMEKLNAKDLVAYLKSSSLSKEIWKKIGKTVAHFHNKGVYHADLNAHNIMLDVSNRSSNTENGLWLIDFDQCEIRKRASSWQQENITRLKRSFDKEKLINQSFYFSENEWQILHDEYLRQLARQLETVKS